MNISAWIVIVTILAIIFYMGYEKNKENKKVNDELGIIYEKQLVKYVGGFREISGNIPINIKISKDKFYVEFINNKVTKSIDVKNIVDAECSTSEEVNRQVSLGKLLIFGVLSFGMSTKKEVKKCAIITYEDEEGTNRSLVFETHPDDLVRHILDIKKLNQ
jgi:hypothetical protein